MRYPLLVGASEARMHFNVLISNLSSCFPVLLFSHLFHEAIVVLFLCAFTHHVTYVYFVVCICYSNVCGFLSVSAENLAKSLMQMERQLLQLEKDLETFSSQDDPTDMFFTKMAISFRQVFVRSVVFILRDSLASMDVKKQVKNCIFLNKENNITKNRWTGHKKNLMTQITDGFCQLVRKPPHRRFYTKERATTTLKLQIPRSEVFFL